MNLEEYQSFVSLSLAQSQQKTQNKNSKSLRDSLNMSQQEKFYHYITLKRWMIDYQLNVSGINEKACDCVKTQAKDQILCQKKELNSLANQYSAPKQIQETNKKIEFRQVQGQRILIIFFEELRLRFRHNRQELQRFLIKLKLKTSLQEFEVWVRANLPTETKCSIQQTKKLLFSTKNRQQSLLFRVLLKKYLKNEAYVHIMTLKNSKKTQLKDSVKVLRSVEGHVFQRNK